MKTTATQPEVAQHPVLLSENKTEINNIDRTAKQWLDNLNAVVDAWATLGILTPYNISILIDNNFKDWFFAEQQRINPILKSINIAAYQFPPEVETIQRVSDWLRHDDTNPMYQLFVKQNDVGRYELNYVEIEKIKNARARKYAESEENRMALALAQRVESAYNAFLEYVEGGVNGSYATRLQATSFLEWQTCPTSKGERERVKLKREQFAESKNLMPHSEIEGLLRLLKAKNPKK